MTGYKTEAERGLNHGKPYKGGRAISTWRQPMAWRRGYQQQDDEPVMHLCWNDCVEFCKWLSGKERVQYSLPTEAEWEYACRAGTETPWSFGDVADFDSHGGKYAIWSDDGQKFDAPQPVAQRRPNAFGLYDMHGNMWEYVSDWWHRLAHKESPLNDPTGPAVQSEKNDLRRIIRGGSFDWGRWGGDSAYRMRTTQRSGQHPHIKGDDPSLTAGLTDCGIPSVDSRLGCAHSSGWRSVSGSHLRGNLRRCPHRCSEASWLRAGCLSNRNAESASSEKCPRGRDLPLQPSSAMGLQLTDLHAVDVPAALQHHAVDSLL